MPDQPPARRTQRERREETERKVLAAATALIAQHGSRALTLAAVGEAAGYSRGIVSHHFGSRENLLRAVMRDAQAFTLPELGDSAADWLAETVRAYLKNVTSRRPSAARVPADVGRGDRRRSRPDAALRGTGRRLPAPARRQGPRRDPRRLGASRCRPRGDGRVPRRPPPRDRAAADLDSTPGAGQSDHRRSRAVHPARAQTVTRNNERHCRAFEA